MKVQVPGEDVGINKRPLDCPLSDAELVESCLAEVSRLCKGGNWRMHVPVDLRRDSDILLAEVAKRFRDRIATPTKRPFLSDGDIDEKSDQASTRYVDRRWFALGARWARDKYEARDGGGVPAVEPKWQPVAGQLVAAWGHNYHKEDRAVVGWYRGQQNADSYREIEDLNNGDTHYRLECALIETLDEIGKPPSYFQERGRCTV